MNPVVTLRKLLTAPLPAATLYLGVMILLLFVIGSSLSDIWSKRADVDASAAMLEQFEGRLPAAVREQTADGTGPSGSICTGALQMSPWVGSGSVLSPSKA